MRAIRVLLVVALAGLSGPVLAQDRAQTLADIRQELTALFDQISSLRSELVASGTQSAPVSGSLLDRMNAIEAELTRLTAQTEALEQRIERVVADGTNRIGDLEFRIVELEGGDISAIGQTPTLGGGTGAAPAPRPAPTEAPQLAVGEQADFDRAREVLGQGDFRTAADQLATFTETYPGSPLSAEAHLLRGEALEGLGEQSSAARAYLDSFSSDPDGPQAGDALVRLGTALHGLGQTQEACVTLTEAGVRFPGTEPASRAIEAMNRLGCN
jgi:tol-pal system protein YbgF